MAALAIGDSEYTALHFQASSGSTYMSLFLLTRCPFVSVHEEVLSSRERMQEEGSDLVCARLLRRRLHMKMSVASAGNMGTR